MSEDKEKLLEGTFSKRELQLIKNALIKLVFEKNPEKEVKVTPLEKRVLSKIEGMLLILNLPDE
jgi:hypothetical protein